jgi:hypothetical protein
LGCCAKMPGPSAPDDSGFSILEAYQRASTAKPIRAKDVKVAYRPYGIKMGGVKRKTDSQLYRLATREVLQWFNQKKRVRKANVRRTR